jgi:L-fuconolactonase
MTIIDSHLHIWNRDRFHYEWLDGIPTLARNFEFQELNAALADSPDRPAQYIFVQADCRAEESLGEVDWVASVASSYPITGIVAAADLELGAGAAAQLEQLGDRPLVVGVRRLLQSEPRGFALQPGFLDGAARLKAAGLSFDAGVTQNLLDDVIELADAVPDLTVVLDHFGKPDLSQAGTPSGQAAFDSWRTSITELAKRPSVYCKISGLPSQASDPTWSAAELWPYFDVAISEFGAERCLFGSDWPASSDHTSYARWLRVVQDWVARLAPAEAAAVLGGTAARAYRLDR